MKAAGGAACAAIPPLQYIFLGSDQAVAAGRIRKKCFRLLFRRASLERNSALYDRFDLPPEALPV